MLEALQNPAAARPLARQSGDRAALDGLVEVGYDHLHRLAAGYVRNERTAHALSPAELVSETFLRLADAAPRWNDRTHFFAVAARIMRRILVDHARRRNAAKRGGQERPVALVEEPVAGERPRELIELDEALSALAAFDERKARAVDMHYLDGMGHREIAAALGVHVNTVARELRLAEAWIYRHLCADR